MLRKCKAYGLAIAAFGAGLLIGSLLPFNAVCFFLAVGLLLFGFCLFH